MKDIITIKFEPSNRTNSLSSSFARAEDKAREEKLMEMETDLNVILQKKKDDGDHPSSAEAYNNSSASSRLEQLERLNQLNSMKKSSENSKSLPKI